MTNFICIDKTKWGLVNDYFEFSVDGNNATAKGHRLTSRPRRNVERESSHRQKLALQRADDGDIACMRSARAGYTVGRIRINTGSKNKCRELLQYILLGFAR